MTVKSEYRTYTCGELRPSHFGVEVTLCGALDRNVDATHFELRDEHGKTLVRLGPDAVALLKMLNAERNPESMVQVKGRVMRREPARVDPDSPTGEVLLDVPKEVKFHNTAKAPLIFDFRDEKLAKRDRIRHRYVYLRKKAVHETFAFRTRLLAEMRRFFTTRRFMQVETPVLANRWTPDATDAFIAVRDPGLSYVLPTPRRAIHGDLLMLAGLDRTFEVARRFEKKAAYGPLEQPEFSVLEANLSYVGEKDIFKLEDELLADLFLKMTGDEVTVRDVPIEDALVLYGSDAPDLRRLEVHDFTRFASAEGVGVIYAFLLPGKATRVKELGDIAKLADGKRTSIHWLVLGLDGKAKLHGTAPRGESLPDRIPKPVGAAAGDLVMLVLSQERGHGAIVMAELRRRALATFGAENAKKHAVARVTRLPYVRLDPATKGKAEYADPLAAPAAKEIAGDAFNVRALAHSLVLDGVKLGSGSIRSHDFAVMGKVFMEVLGLNGEEIEARWGPLLRALQYGLPPRGRFSIGVDRLVALMRGLDSIDETIALPKMPDGTDPLVRAPWPIDRAVVKALFNA